MLSQLPRCVARIEAIPRLALRHVFSSTNTRSFSTKPTDTRSTSLGNGNHEVTVQLPADFDVSSLANMSQEEVLKLLNIQDGVLDEGQEVKVSLDKPKSTDSETKPKPNSIPLVRSSFDPTDAKKPPAGRTSVNMIRGALVRATSHKGALRVIRRVQPEYDNIMPHVREIVRTIMKILKVGYFDLAVTFVTARGIRELNKLYRSIDAPTDVLSFTMDTPADEGVPVEFGEIADLGEIVISLPYAHCMAALRIPYVPLADSEHLGKSVDSILGVEIDDDQQSLDEISIAYEDMDKLAPPLRNIWRKPTAVRKSQFRLPAKFRVRADDLSKLRSPAELDLNNVDVIFEKDGKIKVRPLRSSLPDPYQELLDEAQTVSNSTPAHYNHMDNFSLQKDVESVVSMSPDGTDVSTSPSKSLLSRVTVNALEDEVAILLVHGLLHLVGYDHHVLDARDRMQAKTDMIMKKLFVKGLISRRALIASRYYVLDAVDAETVAAEFGEDAVRSSTGNVFNPADIIYAEADSSLSRYETEINQQAAVDDGEEQEDIDLAGLAQHIETNEQLRSVLLGAGVDILDSEGRVCVEKLKLVDWEQVSELPVDDADMGELDGLDEDLQEQETEDKPQDVVEMEDCSDDETSRR